MYVSSVGHGVCEHKNSYSSGVKQGNYVEDRIGGELAKLWVTQPMSRHTESNTSFADPQSVKRDLGPVQLAANMQGIRNGLPYNAIFRHEGGGQKHASFSTSTIQNTANSEKGRVSLVKKDREARKACKSTKMISTAHDSFRDHSATRQASSSTAAFSSREL